MKSLKKWVIPIVLFIISQLFTIACVLILYKTSVGYRWFTIPSLTLLAVSLIVLYIKIAVKYELLTEKFSKHSIDLKNVLKCYFLIVIFNILCMLLFPDSNSYNDDAIISSMNDSFAIISLVTLSAAVSEEIIFRGFIYEYIFKKSTKGMLISSCLFVLPHIISDNVFSVKVALPYWILSILFCRIYRKTNKLENAILVHLMNNAIPLLLGGLVLLVEGKV